MQFLWSIVVGVCLAAAVSGQGAGTSSSILTDAANAVNSVGNALAGSQTWNIPQQGGVQSGTVWSAPGATTQFNTAGTSGAFQNTQLFSGTPGVLPGVAGTTSAFPTATSAFPTATSAFPTATSFLPGATTQTFSTVDPGFATFSAPTTNSGLFAMGGTGVPFSNNVQLLPGGSFNTGFSTFDSGLTSGVPLNPIFNSAPSVLGSSLPVTGFSNMGLNSQPMTTMFHSTPMINTAPIMDFNMGTNIPYNNFLPTFDTAPANMYMPTFDAMPMFGTDPLMFNQGMMGVANNDDKVFCIPLSNLTPELRRMLLGKK